MPRATIDPMAQPSIEAPARGWMGFWFAPVDPIGLHVCRVLFGVTALVWFGSMLGHQRELFGLDGFVDMQAYRRLNGLGVEQTPLPPIGWSPIFIARTGVALHGLYFGALAALALFTVGVATRVTGFLSWLAVVALTSNPALWHGGDALFRSLAFLLMVGYLLYDVENLLNPRRFLGSPDALLTEMRAGTAATPSVGANLALRSIQVTVAIAMFATGLHKLQQASWWSGTALFFPLYPPLTTDASALRESIGDPTALMTALSLAAYGMIVWQVAFPFVAWRHGARRFIVGGAAIGWLGSAFLFKLPLFGPTLMIGCLAFLPSTSWRRALAWSRPATMESSATVSAAPGARESSPRAVASAV